MGARDLGFMGLRVIAVYFAWLGFAGNTNLAHFVESAIDPAHNDATVTLVTWVWFGILIVESGLAACFWFLAEPLASAVCGQVDDPTIQPPISEISTGLALLLGSLLSVNCGWRLANIHEAHRPLEWVNYCGPTSGMLIGLLLVLRGRRAFLRRNSIGS